jgi:hypothetical protein
MGNHIWQLTLAIVKVGWQCRCRAGMTRTMQVVIDKFGRMVLPKPIRDDLGCGAGTSSRRSGTATASS